MEGSLIRIVFLLALLLQPQYSHADLVNNEWLSTTRALSMGNVGIASADDSVTASFYNPAGIARAKKTVAEFFNPQLEAGLNTFSLSKNTSGFSKNLSLEKIAPALQEKPMKASYLSGSLYPNLHAQNFHFGILLKAEGLSYADFDGKIHYKAQHLLMPSLGLSVGALGGRFKLGTMVRAVNITANDRSVTNTGGIGYTVDPQEGLGVALDAGALFTLPWVALPTIGLVARNVGDTSFSGSAPVSFGSGTSTKKEKIKMTFDSGFAIFPKMGRRSVFTFAVDYRDMRNVYGVNTKRRINLGMELAFNKTFYLRTGISRGYWTAGIGLASKYGSLDIGTYAEELNRTDFRVDEDRRISLRYGSRF